MLQIRRILIVLTKKNGHCEFIFLPEVLTQCNTIPHAILLLLILSDLSRTGFHQKA